VAAGGYGSRFSSLVFQYPSKKGFNQEIQMPVGTSGGLNQEIQMPVRTSGSTGNAKQA
jgi:hypothetical protein